MAPLILFVNHRDQNCGVQQFGQKLYKGLRESTNYSVQYIDPAYEGEFDYWSAELGPEIVIYNYYSGATMPWLSPEKIRRQRGRFKQTCIFHEVPIDNMGFDLIFHQDPSFEGRDGYTNLARPIPRYTQKSEIKRDNHGSPIISSFGFGLGGKGFTTLVDAVQREYDTATIRLNIPYAKFGDDKGEGARSWGDAARSTIYKPGIKLQLTHDLLPEPQLLDWLAESDANCFFYDENYGRGISGTLDYALAVRRPICITKSWQFKHMWLVDDSFLYQGSIQSVIDKGIDHLEKFHEMWGSQKFIESFEHGFRLLGV